MATLSSQITATFGSGSSNIPLRMVNDVGIYIYSTERRIRLYPDVDAQVNASLGTIRKGESKSEDIEWDLVFFDGTDSISATFPIVSGFEYSFEGTILDETGQNEVVPRLTRDANTYGIKSDIKFIGAVRISYTTTYKLLYYTPNTQATYTGVPGIYGLNLHNGVIYAYYQGALAKFEPTLNFGESESNYKLELYRVVSQAIVTELQGVWEHIPGWPTTTTYPTGQSGPDENGSWLVEERVHEIGVITNTELFKMEQYVIPIRQPFTGSYSYTPVYTLKNSYTEIADDPDLSDLLGKVNIDVVNSRLQATYGLQLV